MVFHRPYHLIAHVGAQDLGSELVVVLGCETVTDVVEQGPHHPVDVGTLIIGTGGGLQAMGEAADLVAGEGFFFLLAEFAQHAVRGAADMLVLERLEEQVFLGGSVLHGGEFNGLHALRSREKM